MGADHEIELLVAKRPRVVMADVSLHPRVLAEPFNVAALRRSPAEGPIKTACLERLGVQNPLSTVEGTRPTANVEHLILRFEELEERCHIRLVHVPASSSGSCGALEACVQLHHLLNEAIGVESF